MSRNLELAGLVKWANRDEWRDPFDDVLDEHFGPTFEDYDLDFESLTKQIGETQMTALWACAFEDFMTRPGSDDDERTIVDDYLKRRGWKESTTARRFMEALRDSMFSLHEVVDVVPGQSMLLRDLLRPVEPVRVTEHTATRSLVKGDRLGCRVVEVSGTFRMSGGYLKFDDAATASVLETIGKAVVAMGDEASSYEPEPGVEADPAMIRELAETMVLFSSAPDFTTIWLDTLLNGKLPKVPPPRFNADGEPLEFHSITYPLTAGVSEEALARQLDAIPELRPEAEFLWNWTETAGGREPAQPFSRVEDERLLLELEDGTAVLATVELAAGGLLLYANSKLRADRAKLMLKSVLKGKIGQPTTQIHSPEDEVEMARSLGAAVGRDVR